MNFTLFDVSYVSYMKHVYPKIHLHIYHCIKDGSFCIICSSLQVVATDVVSALCVSCVFGVFGALMCHRVSCVICISLYFLC